MPLFKSVQLLVLTLLLSFGFFFVLSATEVSAQVEQGLSLRVSPPILEIDIEPGTTYSDYIKFENINEFESLTLYPQILSFKARGEEGAQEFLEDSEETLTYSLAQWVNISTDTLEVEPLERVVLPFTITVPEDAEPGGRYAAILLGNQPNILEAGNNVALGAQTGTIILAKIEGDVYESAKINQFNTGLERYQYPPVDFNIVVENTGNVHVKPVGVIEITNLFGMVVDEVVVNDAGGNVLPESTRKFTPSWEREKFTLGRYKATLSLEYGEESQKFLTDSLSFWVLPMKEIIIASVVILIAIVLLVVLIKSYNKMIVKKALKMQQQGNQENQGEK